MPNEPKKTRAKRRDFKRELEELTLYCKIMIEVLSGGIVTRADDEIAVITCYRDILTRLEKQ